MMKIQDRALRDRSITEVVDGSDKFLLDDGDVEEPFSFIFQPIVSFGWLRDD